MWGMLRLAFDIKLLFPQYVTSVDPEHVLDTSNTIEDDSKPILNTDMPTTLQVHTADSADVTSAASQLEATQIEETTQVKDDPSVTTVPVPQTSQCDASDEKKDGKTSLDLSQPIELSSESVVMVGGKKCMLRVDPDTQHLVAYPVKPILPPGLYFLSGLQWYTSSVFHCAITVDVKTLKESYKSTFLKVDM